MLASQAGISLNEKRPGVRTARLNTIPERNWIREALTQPCDMALQRAAKHGIEQRTKSAHRRRPISGRLGSTNGAADRPRLDTQFDAEVRPQAPQRDLAHPTRLAANCRQRRQSRAQSTLPEQVVPAHEVRRSSRNLAAESAAGFRLKHPTSNSPASGPLPSARSNSMHLLRTRKACTTASLPVAAPYAAPVMRKRGKRESFRGRPQRGQIESTGQPPICVAKIAQRRPFLAPTGRSSCVLPSVRAAAMVKNALQSCPIQQDCSACQLKCSVRFVRTVSPPLLPWPTFGHSLTT